MFYSHQLLARKAPLGQIWRAATMHQKINRKNLNKLNIINICDEILNPKVPMALRLTGILMGGVCIVYERKVKLLYEDVTRLLVELNEAWKVKPTRDPTVLPKGKTQAKYEAVTLPDDQISDLGEDQHFQFSNSDTVIGIHISAYTEMNLDNIDESYISHNQGEAELPRDYYQVDNDNITIPDRFDSHQADAGRFNKFERFDTEGDYIEQNEGTHTDLPAPLPSTPPQDGPQNPDEIRKKYPEDYVNHQSDEHKAQDSPQIKRPPRKRARRAPIPVMDCEQTIIPGSEYQSWLQDTSDILRSGRGRKRKHSGSMHSTTIARLMDLPPVTLVCGLIMNGKTDVYYPTPLLKQWMKCKPVIDSPSADTPPPHPAASSSSPSPEANNYHNPTSFPFEDHHSGVGCGSLEASIETLLPHINKTEIRAEIPVKEFGTAAKTDVAVTPANSITGDGVKSISSEVHVSYGRPKNMKRNILSSRQSGSSLKPVVEEYSFDQPIESPKLPEENEMEPENDLFVETGPTQTQKVPMPDQQKEQLTDSIRLQLKTHFDTPGGSGHTLLSQLAMGLDRKGAACLFYQTCVLASRDFIKVYQKQPYQDILISRGIKM
uniref:sister chromatid cohesion 1 protein 1-like n=1 Tax=Erigeron canadensis TaxID=72917 RepID=UPI001CB9194B|nr:sister chromatid cohesion 1 protein 1-like [Erigeron canadensis]